MIAQLLAWFSDPTRWSGADGIPARLGEHLLYSFVVVAAAALVAVPVGLFIGHTGKGRWLVNTTNAARAVPSLGLLFAAALWIGPMFTSQLAFLLPSLLALVVLAMPPLLSGAYAGVESVDPAARDAAYGIGMTGRQVLFGVELPGAMPLLLSGVRSTVLQVVATATIASFVSLGGLGRYLVDGLASGDYPQMAGGAILVMLLALGMDAVLAVLTPWFISPGLRAAARADDPRRPRSRRASRAATTASSSPEAP